jgi:hypothetical protein
MLGVRARPDSEVVFCARDAEESDQRCLPGVSAGSSGSDDYICSDSYCSAACRVVK